MLRPLRVSFSLIVSILVACASGGDKNGGTPIEDSATGGDTGGGGDSTTLDVGHNDGFTPDASDIGFDGACATASYEAKQQPASLLFVLDRSNTMNNGGKWDAAVLGIYSVIDLDSFDHMTLGLMASPATTVTGPSCLFGLPVMCGNSALPQVAMSDSGTDKTSAATGVRHNIYNWLTTNSPDPDAGDGSGTPLYDALDKAYKFIRLAGTGKLLVTFVVNGAASCTSLSTRPGYTDANSCPDWEHPDVLATLIKTAHDDPTQPVSTFVIGVPGADTTGSDPTTQPPYHLKRALSAYALAGSPETVPAGCDGAFSTTGGDPTLSCHYDMTAGTLDAKALAGNLAKIRGTALGCIFDLPTPTDGSTVDKNKVNVEIDDSGPPPTTDALKKRSDPSDTCATDGCWDYTPDGKIEILGKACDDVKTLTSGKVQIIVGCATVIK